MIAAVSILFTAALVPAIFPVKDERNRKIILFCLAIPMILVAAFRPTLLDYANYEMAFERINDGGTALVEVSFVIIARITGLFSDNAVWLFLVYAILGVSLKLTGIRQLTGLWFLSLAIYLSNFYILQEAIQIRAGVAAGFALLCIKPIYERDGGRFLIMLLCAMLFHYSAIVLLPAWLLGGRARKWILALAVPAGYMLYFVKINIWSLLAKLPVIGPKMSIYELANALSGGESTVNVFSIVFLVKIVIFYLILWKLEYIGSFNKYTPLMMKIWALSLFLFPTFASSPVLAFRLQELLGVVEIILIPLLFYIIRPRALARIAVVLIALGLFYINVFHNNFLTPV